MATSYLTESLAGPTSARGSSYSYSYESHYDNPPEEEYEHFTNDDGVHQMQKVTRVTKVTTTRSVRQVPVQSPYSNIDFDSSGLPTPSPVIDRDPSLEMMARMGGASDHDSEDRSAPPPAPASRFLHEDSGIPSAPGVPDVVDAGIGEVTVVWSAPLQSNGGEVRGYQIEMREFPDGEWESMGVDHLLKDTTCRVTNLTSHEVQFRVSAYGRTGFGPASNPSLPVKIPISETDLATSAGAPLAPGRPTVIAVDGQGVLLEWTPPVADVHSSPPQGYQVEYRVYGSRDWIVANEQLVQENVFTVESLRPNGVYEFRVRGKNQDGLGHPSMSSGGVAIRPAAPQRHVPARKVSESVQPPGQPQMVEVGDDVVKLEWAPSVQNARYIVEYREVGDPEWHTANYDPIVQNGIQVEGLHRNSTYEFCVISIVDNIASQPSETSDIIHLRPTCNTSALRPAPNILEAPEFLEVDGDKITICWLPAQSQLPVMGYDVEFRDLQQDDRWYKVNDQPVFACKMTVGDLIMDHDYQFRVLAHNASGCSQPSPPSDFVHIEPSTNRFSSDTMESPHLGHHDVVKYVEAERFGAVPLLQEEMVRESPPLPERDDSPPPLRRANNNVQWRDPSLKEVIEYLSSADKDKQLNASGYLQHLTYTDNQIKEETREYGGIPKLIALLRSDTPRIQKNACACLKNLSFGKENDANKLAVMEADGVRLIAEVLRTTHDASVKEEAAAALWNLSSADMLKPVILESATEILSQQVIAPVLAVGTSDPTRHFGSTLFKNSTGVLRNVSAASQQARRRLRDIPNLIEALVHFLTHAIQKSQVDSPTVENAVCLLRNLSYRIQEVVDPNYDPAAAHSSSSKNMKHVASPKPEKKKKDKEKKKDKNPKNIVTGPSVLWQPHVVKLYLKLLQDSSNIETLEASAGAIQNLAACQFPPSAEVRAAVRVEKGLPVLVELIRLPEDFVVCAVATALRNLAIDPRNRELIGKYALRDFLDKLPEPGSPRRSAISDQTIGAVLGILFEIVRSSAAYTKDVHELKGTDKLRALSRSYPTYSHRVCKYASQVLYVMWQHKELHDGFKRSGLKEADFYSGTARRGDSSTLARPISSQGRERPSMHQLDETLSSGGGYGTMESNNRAGTLRPASATSQTIQRRYDQVPRDGPVYSSVQKPSPRGGGGGGNIDDSWV
ncbi:Fibronectin type-III domain-containing protein [Caenorhabditis elegans]|nr:Fibronectin type-III domain-containing protein [Caenorhabditis elegans]CBJ25105.1 Fibronectin type-III domain-containing protein [Caenorhabditis elegans]|eukprot:NP_001255881.1 Juxtamembrane domain-associated catenin [Caenorhabditis elegans]